MDKSFNVILTTINRPSLKGMVDSILPQLNEIDYLTIIVDDGDINNELTKDAKCNVIWIKNSEKLGCYGHGSRNKWQNILPGDYFMNGDDDDIYTEGAMDTIRKKCTQNKLYIFKMLFDGKEVWDLPSLHFANIGTPCGVYPKIINLPKWEERYGGDFDFYESLSKRLDYEFCDNIIYKVKG